MDIILFIAFGVILIRIFTAFASGLAGNDESNNEKNGEGK